MLKLAHVQTCLKFFGSHLDDPEEENVMWSDYIKMELFGVMVTCHVWREENAELHHNPIPTL